MKNKLIEYKKRLAKSHTQKWHKSPNTYYATKPHWQNFILITLTPKPIGSAKIHFRQPETIF